MCNVNSVLLNSFIIPSKYSYLFADNWLLLHQGHCHELLQLLSSPMKNICVPSLSCPSVSFLSFFFFSSVLCPFICFPSSSLPAPFLSLPFLFARLLSLFSFLSRDHFTPFISTYSDTLLFYELFYSLVSILCLLIDLVWLCTFIFFFNLGK